MARISTELRAHNEEAIRAAMGRLLHGPLPPDRRRDLKTRASEAGMAGSASTPSAIGTAPSGTAPTST